MLLQLGESKEVFLNILDQNENPVINADVVVSVKNLADNSFFNGISFTEEETELLVSHKENGVYSFVFIPNFCSIFEITIRCDEYNLVKSENIEVYEVSNQDSDSIPIMINQLNFISQNGTDSVVVDEKGKPLSKVKISVYRKDTQELVAATQTDISGNWNLMIPAGEYVFLFKKDGFITSSFERTVG